MRKSWKTARDRKKFTKVKNHQSFLLRPQLQDSNKLVDLDEKTISAVIAKHFKSTCNLCSTQLCSFEQAKNHYRTEHQDENGYLECCGRTFKRRHHLVGHVRWHLNPNVFKWVAPAQEISASCARGFTFSKNIVSVSCLIVPPPPFALIQVCILSTNI